MIDSIKSNTFIPIVTTYTITSQGISPELFMNDSQLLSQVFLDYQQRVGFDSLPIMEDSTFTAEAFGCKIGFTEREAFVTEPLTIPSEEKIENYPVPKPKNCNRIQLILEAVQNVSRFASKEKPVIANSTAPLTSAAKTLGMENLLKRMIREPKLITIFLNKVTEFIISFTDALLEAGADIIFVADPVASPDVISPKMFRKFAFPQLKLLIQRIRRPTILHICGNIYPIVHDMIQTAPTMLSVDHCVSIKKVRDMVGKDIILGGNLAPGEILLEKTPGQVTNESWRCCREGGKENFILMPGCTIVPDTPVGNLRAMMNVAKQSASKN